MSIQAIRSQRVSPTRPAQAQAPAPTAAANSDGFTASSPPLCSDALRLKLSKWGASLASAAFLSAPLAAHANDNPSEAGAAAPVASAVPQKPPSEEVPWYDPLEQRSHDINDGFKGFKDNVGAYATKFERRLNDNALGNYHESGTLGDYHWTFDGMHVHLDPYITLQANRAGAGVRGDVSVARAVLQKEVHDGDWTRTQGIRADLYGRVEVGEGSVLNVHGLQPDAPRGHFLGPRVEMFTHWKHDGDHAWKISADLNVGTSIDVSNRAPITYARGIQRFENDQLTKRMLGEGSRVRVELEEGIQYNANGGRVDPYYRAFGGVGKPVHIHLKGKDRRVDVELGLQATGTREQAFKLGPQLRARLHW